ncbi:MAG: hypothetical protein ABWK01_02885 [Infirmifilum sp.]
MKKVLILVVTTIVLALFFISFLYKKEANESKNAIDICIKECKKALASGMDLSKGPCLLNPIKEMPDWVCDVAHSPREPIDNLPENQCSSFREGKATHFVEVSPTCELIRVY